MSGGLSSVIGDGSLNGWATFLVYLVIAWLCFRNARGSVAQLGAGGRRVALARSRRRFWAVMAGFVMLLGLTRQLDLQALVANLARNILSADGMYDDRSQLQIALVIAVGAFGILGLVAALMTFRRADGPILTAMAGAVLLLVFTLIRTISLHDVDRFLRRGAPHFQVNNLIEIGALLIIAAASLAFFRRLRGEAESARLRALSIQERRRRIGDKRSRGRS